MHRYFCNYLVGCYLQMMQVKAGTINWITPQCLFNTYNQLVAFMVYSLSPEAKAPKLAEPRSESLSFFLC